MAPIAVLAAIAAVSCGESGGTSTVIGSGTVVEDVRTIAGFTSIELEGDAVVRIDAGVTDRVVVEADDNLLDHLTTDVDGARLVLGVEDGHAISPTERVVYRIGVSTLRGVAVSGIGDVEVRGVGGDELEVDLDGVGDVRVAGAVRHLDARLDGAGSIDASRLMSATAAASIEGTGDVTVAASDVVEATIDGTGNVRYVGSPSVQEAVRGTGAVQPASAPPPSAPTTEWPIIGAPSLAGNLLGDPAELPVAVWLPASYATSPQRYPVVYYLAGYGEASSVAAIGDALATLIGSGDAPEMIVVGASGANSLGGSFYVDSPVTGGWAAAIHADLVSAIDQRYRTVAEPSARGIAGFSMGGFGALDLAMRHPDVFGATFALSPGLFAPGGLEATDMFAEPGDVADFLAVQELLRSGDGSPPMTESVRFSLAYGSAFAPDVDGGPPWVTYPFVTAAGPRDPAVWARWDAGYGGIAAEVTAHADALRQLRGIGVDVGTNDAYEWIPDGARFFAEQLAAHSIDVQLTTHDGGHGPVGPRALAVMLPFFADVLAPSA